MINRILPLIVLFALSTGTLKGQSQNIKRVETPLVPVTEEAVLNSLSYTEKLQTLQYTDASGKPLQDIHIGASPQGNDVIQGYEYDQYGRPLKSHLPYVSTLASRETFRTDWSAELSSYYSTAGTETPNETKPYSKVEVENSPMQRVKKSYGLGSRNLDNDHYVSSKTGVIGIGDVRKWVITADGLPRSYSTHLANILVYQETISTMGQKSQSVTDASGKSITTRVYRGEEEVEITRELCIEVTGECFTFTDTVLQQVWTSTYAVYDELGRLRYMLPPALTKNFTPTQEEVDQYATQYQYDDENRLIKSKFPGADWVITIYDQWDRPVLTQDGNQRAKSPAEWSFVKYDYLNRPIASGTWKTNKSYATIKSEAKTHAGKYESTNTSAVGYTLSSSYPSAVNADDLLIIKYYDGYDFLTNTGWDAEGHNFDFVKPAGFTEESSIFTLDYTTATKVKLIDDNRWMNHVMYYNDEGQQLQVVSEHHLAGVNRKTYDYDFTGSLTKSLLEHASSTDAVSLLQEYVYDHGGRLNRHYHTIDGGTRVLLAHYLYNELGSLIEKNLHSTDEANFLQSIDYRYNAEGALLSINNSSLSTDASNDDTDDLFGMQMSYGDQQVNIGGAATDTRADGSLTAVQWQSKSPKSNTKQKVYGYGYDKDSRIKQARYAEGNGTTWNDAVDHHALENVTYDEQGNILTLKRNAALNGSKQVMDDLTYSYQGNQVQSIEDTGSSFGYDNQTVGLTTEIDYDANGNTTYDLNKGITSIAYNQLNRTQTITYTGGEITYLYDAEVSLLGMTLAKGGEVVRQLDYVAGIQYVDGQIATIGTDQGRVLKMGDGQYYYEYFLQDYLGNNRLSFGLLPKTDVYTATMEDAYSGTEEGEFMNIGLTRAEFAAYNHTAPSMEVTTPNKVAALNAYTGKAIGPSKSLEVSAGDKIHLEAYATYFQGTGGSNAIISDLIGAVAGAFGLPTVGVEAAAFDALSTSLPVFSGSVATDPNVPKAYLNYIFFDQDFANPQFGYVSVTEDAKDAFQKLALDIVMPYDGYVYIYVANESSIAGVDVFFDDLQIIHTQQDTELQVLSSADYYPFGLPYHQYQNEGVLANSALYQGKHYDEELRLYDFHARFYDPATGRFLGVDPQASSFAYMSPYAGMMNSPMLYIDPNGEFPFLILAAVAVIGGAINVATNWDKIDNFWDGAKYFGVGAAAGAAATVAVFYAAPALAALGTGAIGGAAAGAIGGAAAGFVLGSGNTWLDGGNFIEGIAGGMMGAATGALTGAVTGGVISGSVSVIKGNNFWTGAPKPLPVPGKVDGKSHQSLAGKPETSSTPQPTTTPSNNTSQLASTVDDQLGGGKFSSIDDFAGKKIYVDKSSSTTGHIFRNAPGHVNPSSATTQSNYLQLFEKVASNPANLRVDAVASNLIPQQAVKAGVQVYTQTFNNGQVWVFIRNGRIFDAGVNLIPR